MSKFAWRDWGYPRTFSVRTGCLLLAESNSQDLPNAIQDSLAQRRRRTPWFSRVQNARNTNNCSGFFRTGFRSYDRRRYPGFLLWNLDITLLIIIWRSRLWSRGTPLTGFLRQWQNCYPLKRVVQEQRWGILRSGLAVLDTGTEYSRCVLFGHVFTHAQSTEQLLFSLSRTTALRVRTVFTYALSRRALHITLQELRQYKPVATNLLREAPLQQPNNKGC